MTRKQPDRGALTAEFAACLTSGIQSQIFPGAVLAYRPASDKAACTDDIVVAQGALGYEGALSDADFGAVPVSPDTIYDLASLTKVVATLPLMLLSVQQGKLSLEDSIAGLLPELGGDKGVLWPGAITVRQLLSHTGGLPAWRPYYLWCHGAQEYLAAIAQESPVYRPGTAVEYSDLGFILAGFALERLWDEGLPSLAERLVVKPLGMQRTTWLPASAKALRTAVCAPTEWGTMYERDMALEYVNACRTAVDRSTRGTCLSIDTVVNFPWRRSLVQGAVHDGNAYYGLDGVSGHAGLFSCAGDMQKYLDFWKPGYALSAALRKEVFTQQTPQGAISRGLGFLLDADGTAFHTGFTGPMLRYNPQTEDALVVLTNRVHPQVKEGIGLWREELVAALKAALL